jgi:SulP family sulfate permease
MLLLGILTVLIYYLIPLLTKAIPSVSLIGALSYFLGWDVPLLERFHLNSKFTDWNPIQYYTTRSIHLSSAAVLAVLGSIDSLLTSVIADNMTKTRHNSNRELIGQGIGNASCCFWGIPGAGATKVP